MTHPESATALYLRAHTLQRNIVDHSLDHGLIKYKMPNGNEWSVRRNGATHTWKREQSRYRIPIKIGFRSHGYITENTKFAQVDERYVIVSGL